jgi:hypothetical protein
MKPSMTMMEQAVEGTSRKAMTMTIELDMLQSSSGLEHILIHA